MPNNLMFTTSGAKSRRFVAPAARQRKGPSGRVIRGAIGIVGVALVLAFVFVGKTLYGKQAELITHEEEKGPLGQWEIMRDETVAIPAKVAGGGLRAGEPGQVVITRVPRRKRHIVLSTGEGRWNTGVWPNWGQGTPDVTLNWAAAGVAVHKGCSSECTITHDQSGLADSDAVVMEAVNHPKFGIPASIPLPFPSPRDNSKRLLPGPAATAIPESLPLKVLFYFEATQSWPQYTLANKELASKFDITMTPDQSSTLPVTLICPWGRPVGSFVADVDAIIAKKAPERLFGYFNEHGIAPAYSSLVGQLFAAAGDKLHAYQHRSNRPIPPEFDHKPYQLSERLDFMGTYKFLLVTEAIEESDWIEPEFSQALLSGAVPVYIGAPNVMDFVPGPRSIIHIRDFASGEALWQYLESFGPGGAREAEYKDFHAWRASAMETFLRDEMGSEPQLGTGQGISHHQIDRETRVANLHAWSAFPDDKGAIPSLDDLKQAVGGGGDAFNEAAVNAWRSFRVKLDECVHYAECRLCELVSILT